LAEKELLFAGELDKNEYYDYAYYDAKIKYMDKKLFQPLVKLLKDLDIWDDTTIIVTSDHGETLGTKNPSWKTFFFEYPQHKTMYESDLKIPLIIKNKNLKSQEINHTVRAIDIVPTIIGLLKISSTEDFDGINLVPLMNGGKLPELIAYSEELFEKRGPGSIQSLRTNNYKLIRNVTKNQEEFYDIENDPEEMKNIIDTSDPSLIKLINEFRNVLSKMYNSYKKKTATSREEKTRMEKLMIKKLVKKLDLKQN